MISAEEADAHRARVIALSKPGEPLAVAGATATVNNPDWFLRGRDGRLYPRASRAALQGQMIQDEIAEFPHARADKKALILAGPPGAGKGTILGSLLGPRRDDYVRVDADEFKARLIEQARADGSYEAIVKPDAIKDLEAAGDRFYPMELAALFHAESAMMARAARDELIAEGVNVVIDTVLSDLKAARSLITDLEAAEYSVDVVDVEVSYEISEARIAKRWLQEYAAAAAGDPAALGGRWVPSEYARGVFDGPGGRSLPEVCAETIAHQSTAVTRYRRWRTTTMETDSAPAIGSWEVDKTRPTKTSALIDTATLKPAATAPAKLTVTRDNPAGKTIRNGNNDLER